MEDKASNKVIIDKGLIEEMIAANNSVELDEMFENLRWVSSDVAYDGYNQIDIDEKDNCIKKLRSIIEAMVYMQNVSASISLINEKVNRKS